MRKLLCKIFRFLLDLVKQLVDLVADTLVYIGTAAVEVLGAVADAVSDAFLSSPIGIAIIGIGAYWLITTLGKNKEKGKGDDSTLDLVNSKLTTRTA